MTLGETFERFLQQAPITVMVRALLERTLSPEEINRGFERDARNQYHREILFSAMVKLMGAVVCGVQPSVRAAYLNSLGEIAARRPSWKKLAHFDSARWRSRRALSRIGSLADGHEVPALDQEADHG